MAAGQIVPAVVSASGAGRRTVRLRIGRYAADLGREATAWTGRGTPSDFLTAGDLIEVRITKVDEAARSMSVTLEQTPIADGGVLAIDNRTGQIRAMVGGLSFARSKFNRATQAQRQMGSGFKPIVYTAAIDRGLTPTTILIDTPVSYPAGAGKPPWSPHNYDGKYEGAVTLRHALEESRNVPAVRTMDQIGAKQVIEYARRFGLQGPMEPYLPIALGAAEASLLELTAAYAAFPNQGVLMKPYQILKVVDRQGNLLEENRPQPREAIRADTAYVMTSLLRGVVQRGTGAAAAALEWPLGGKTGTTDDYTDAWFTGFDPDLTIRRLGRPRRSQAARDAGNGCHGRAADLDGCDEGPHRQAGRPQESPRLRGAGQHRVRHRRPGDRAAAVGRRTRRAERGVHRGHPAWRHQVVNRLMSVGRTKTSVPGSSESARNRS